MVARSVAIWGLLAIGGACAGKVSSDAGTPPPDGGGDETVAGPSDAALRFDGGALSDAGGVDASTLPDASARSYLRVFVSSALYRGDLGGLAGADAKCQALAIAAGLGGTFKAWLSDSTTSARSRLSHGTVPYRLVDGTLIAFDWNDLTTNYVHFPIDKTEKNGAPQWVPVGTLCGNAGQPPLAWTGTDRQGDPVPGDMNCGDWTSAAVQHGGVWGRADYYAGPEWTYWCRERGGSSPAPCAIAAALYCFEQ